jgi:hypothetical protein
MKCFFGHKWNYYKEDVVINYPMGSTLVIKDDRDVRMCDNCGIKHRKLIDTFHRKNKWVKTATSKNEERDFKIKKLLK